MIPRAAVPPAPPHTIYILSGWGALSRSQFQHKPAVATEAGFASKNPSEIEHCGKPGIFHSRLGPPKQGTASGSPRQHFFSKAGRPLDSIPAPRRAFPRRVAPSPAPPPELRSRSRGQQRGGAGTRSRLCRGRTRWTRGRYPGGHVPVGGAPQPGTAPHRAPGGAGRAGQSCPSAPARRGLSGCAAAPAPSSAEGEPSAPPLPAAPWHSSATLGQPCSWPQPTLICCISPRDPGPCPVPPAAHTPFAWGWSLLV